MVRQAVWHIAQVNIARAQAPLDDPLLAGFVAKLNEINRLADMSPGFVWRLQSDNGNATDILAFDDPRMIINLSVWQSIQALLDFVYRPAHAPVMARRRDWFAKLDRPHLALWWIPAGTLPTVAAAVARLDHLQCHGPTDRAFTFKQRFAPPQPELVASR